MPGLWIVWTKGLAKKREVLAIAKKLKQDRHYVAGVLMEFWEWIDSEAVDGYVDALASHDAHTCVDGMTPQFTKAMIEVGWLVENERGLFIPHFERWMSENAKKRLEKNERQGRWRCKKQQAYVDAPVDASAPTTEENRREYKNNTNHKAAPSDLFAANARENASGSPPPFMEFPTNGKGKKKSKSWLLSVAKVEEYKAAFPGVDVEQELRNALQWIRDNPARRKTASGMLAFLTRWLTRQQNHGGTNRNGTAPHLNNGQTFEQRFKRIFDEQQKRKSERGHDASRRI